MAEHERSRAAKKARRFSCAMHDLVSDLPATRFAGYTETTSVATVLGLIKDEARSTELEPGDEAVVILDRTPFYATSGGQEHDTGTLSLAEKEVADVLEVAKSPTSVPSQGTGQGPALGRADHQSYAMRPR